MHKLTRLSSNNLAVEVCIVMNADEFRTLLSRWAQIMEKNKEELTRLDGLCGDSDLGLNMSAGFASAAIVAASSSEKDIGKLSYLAGKAMSTAVPSTMGTLMASGLMSAGKELIGVEILDDQQQALFFSAFYEGVKGRGKAQPGDKTFLDGLKPALDGINHALQMGQSLASTAQEAAAAAQRGFEQTCGMLARHGRVAIRGEASKEYLDPGAAVAALLMRGWADQISGG
jgi:dihydroxyacetone kinase-like protein